MSSSPIRRESPNGSRLGQVQPTGEELADGFILGWVDPQGAGMGAWGGREQQRRGCKTCPSGSQPLLGEGEGDRGARGPRRPALGLEVRGQGPGLSDGSPHHATVAGLQTWLAEPPDALGGHPTQKATGKRGHDNAIETQNRMSRGYGPSSVIHRMCTDTCAYNTHRQVLVYVCVCVCVTQGSLQLSALGEGVPWHAAGGDQESAQCPAVHRLPPPPSPSVPLSAGLRLSPVEHKTLSFSIIYISSVYPSSISICFTSINNLSVSCIHCLLPNLYPPI